MTPLNYNYTIHYVILQNFCLSPTFFILLFLSVLFSNGKLLKGTRRGYNEYQTVKKNYN